MAKIFAARQVELDRIKRRAKVYARVLSFARLTFRVLMAFLFSGMMGLSTGVPVVVTLATFGAYIFAMGKPLTASTAFTSMALFGLLREAVSEWKRELS